MLMTQTDLHYSRVREGYIINYAFLSNKSIQALSSTYIFYVGLYMKYNIYNIPCI